MQRRQRRRRQFRRQVYQTLLRSQQNEINEHFIYQKLASLEKNPQNRKVLEKIAKDEYLHYQFWRKYTAQEIAPNQKKIWFYTLLARFFGLTFAVKLMEKGEEEAQAVYQKIAGEIPEAGKILQDEERHEKEVLRLINEEMLNYMGAIVLGLNDALVELTGALAGFTLAFQNTRFIAVAGLITGVAASFSMASSEYLSVKSEGEGKNPLKSAFYTGTAYIITVFLLLLPYFILPNLYLSLISALLIALLIIFIFTYYLSVAKDFSFKKRFFEMARISLGVSLFTFLLGFLVRAVFKIEI